MRTTLTLDDDVVALLRRELKSSGASLKQVVNEALRRMLVPTGKPEKKRRPFRTPTVDLGPSLIGNLDNVSEVLDFLEGPTRRDSC